MLGRSLSANAYYPNDLLVLLDKQIITKLDNLYIKDIEESKSFDKHTALLVKDASILPLAKRYLKNTLIFTQTLNDEHELLLALVFGADAIVLKDESLINKALHFGLSIIYKASKSSEIPPGIIPYFKDKAKAASYPSRAKLCAFECEDGLYIKESL